MGGLEILPDRSAVFVGVLAEQVGGVEGRHEGDAPVAMPRSSLPGNGHVTAQQKAGGGLAQADDDFGLHRGDLTIEEDAAGFHLGGLWVAILRRPALDDIADVDLGARDAQALFDHVGEKFTGLAHEGQASKIFLLARTFPYEEQVGVRISVSKDDLSPAFAEAAAPAIPKHIADGFQSWRRAPARREFLGVDYLR